MRQFLLILCSSCFYALPLRSEETTPGRPVLCAASADFVVRSYPRGPSASAVLEECRQLREQLAAKWLGEGSPATWAPQCEVVIHATKSQYLRAVGSGGAQTTGSSIIQTADGRIVARRIDLVADPRGELSALAHELTHVVLADRFKGRQPPRWLDEGIALLSDSPRKQALHQRDCRTALDSGTAMRLGELLLLDDFTSSQQMPAFYGQSHSLVQYLADRDEPARVISFVEAAMAHGYDRALAQHYGVHNVAELERAWKNHVVRSVRGSPQTLLTSSAR